MKVLTREQWMSFVALGIVSTVLCILIYGLRDLWFLFVGTYGRFSPPRRIFYLVLASIAVLFSIAMILESRRALYRIAFGLLSIAMTSYMVETFVALSASQLRVIAICRIVVSVSLILPLTLGLSA